MKLIFGKQNKSVVSPINAKTPSWRSWCYHPLNKLYFAKGNYINVSYTDNTLLHYAIIFQAIYGGPVTKHRGLQTLLVLSWVLEVISHGISLTFAVPDCRWKCASYWIYSESGVPLSSITFDCKATHCGPMHELWIQTVIAVLHRCGAE